MPKYLYGFSSRDGAKRRRIQQRSEGSDFDSDPYFLRGYRIYILPTGVGNSRRKVLQNLVKKHGGTVVHSVNDSTTHVLVDETISSANVCRALGWTIFPPHISVVMVGWLSASIRANNCIDIAEYEIPCVNKASAKECPSSLRRNVNTISFRTDTLVENGFHPQESLSENADGGELTNDEIMEEESTFDDGVYDGETTCDDEWLQNAVPEPLMFGLINSVKRGTSNIDPNQTESSSLNYSNLSKLKSLKHFGPPNSKSSNFSYNNSDGKVPGFSDFKTNSESTNFHKNCTNDVAKNSFSEKRFKLSKYRPFSITKPVNIYSKPNQNSSMNKSDLLNFNQDLSIPACIRQEISQLYASKSNIPQNSIPVTHSTDSENKELIPHSNIQQNSPTTLPKSLQFLVESLESSPLQPQSTQDSELKAVTSENKLSNVMFQSCSNVESSSVKLKCVKENLEKCEAIICDTSKFPSEECDPPKKGPSKPDFVQQKQESELNANVLNSVNPEPTAFSLVSGSNANISNSESVPDALNSKFISDEVPSNESEKKSNKNLIEEAFKSESVIETSQAKMITVEPPTSNVNSAIHDHGTSANKTEDADIDLALQESSIDKHSPKSISSPQDNVKCEQDPCKHELNTKNVDTDIQISNSWTLSDGAKVDSVPLKPSVPLLAENNLLKFDQSSQSIEVNPDQLSHDERKCSEVEAMSVDFTLDGSVLEMNAVDASSVGTSNIEKSCDPSDTDLKSPKDESLATSNHEPFNCTDKNLESVEYIIHSEMEINDDNNVNHMFSPLVNRLLATGDSSFSSHYTQCISSQEDLDNLVQSISVAKSNTDIALDVNTSQVSASKQAFCSEASQLFCSEGRCKSSCSQNSNSFICSKLQMMYEYFKRNGDKWRVHAYEKAIIALRTYPKPVTTYEEATSLNGMGKKIAQKIIHWVKTGDFNEVDVMCSRERSLAMKIFTRAWGIGPRLAAELYKQGHRTVLDLRRNSDLSRAQLVGLRYFDDLKTRMPREEAQRILSTVLSRIFDLYSYVQCDACSSLRRNQKYCGHVNILVTLPEGVKNNHKILPEIVARLHQEGFLIDDLIRHDENGSQTRYSGIFKLKFEGAKHRRLDITVCSRDEYACALMYLTGSTYFNRAIRQVAQKRNMILNEHSLRVKTSSTLSVSNVSTVEPVTSEEIIHTPSETAIFTHLGLPYRSPEQRDRSFF